jgi:hypothetical protein
MRAKRLGLLFILAPAFCAGADQSPPPDLLEFLGTGAQEGTQWIDPLSLRETPEPFAGLTGANQEGRKRDHPVQRPDAAPQQNATEAPPRDKRDDGGNEDDD